MSGYGLFYFISEAFRGLRANGVVNLLAAGTISMAMLIVGFFLLVYVNVSSSLHALEDRMEMSVYLRDGLTQYEKDYLQRLLRAERGVKKAVYLSRDEALELFRRELKGQEALIQGLGGNPLPDSFELVIERTHADAERLEALAKRMSGWRGVEEVSYGKQGARTLSGLIKAFTYGGAALAILLGVSVVFIISNSVRLALYSREQEIELMQWIGATRGFIQWPFLIEGTMLAMLGSALAVGILVALYYALPPEAALFLAQSNGLDFLPLPVVAYMTIGGGLLGLAGGFIAVSRSLE